MSVNPDLVGRRFALPEPYLVGREHVREFARAVFATNPVHLDLDAAREAGYTDLVAPATFAAVLQDRAMQLLLADPQVDFELKQLVHGDQRFTFVRPIVAGDELSTELEVTSVRALGRNSLIQATVRIADAAGTEIVTALASLVVGAPAEEEAEA